MFFSHIFWRCIFSKSSITFHYKHLGSFTLFFVCAECMGWYFENICKYTVKPAIVVTSIRRNLRKLVSLSKFQMYVFYRNKPVLRQLPLKEGHIFWWQRWPCYKCFSVDQFLIWIFHESILSFFKYVANSEVTIASF